MMTTMIMGSNIIFVSILMVIERCLQQLTTAHRGERSEDGDLWANGWSLIPDYDDNDNDDKNVDGDDNDHYHSGNDDEVGHDDE